MSPQHTRKGSNTINANQRAKMQVKRHKFASLQVRGAGLTFRFNV